MCSSCARARCLRPSVPFPSPMTGWPYRHCISAVSPWLSCWVPYSLPPPRPRPSPMPSIRCSPRYADSACTRRRWRWCSVWRYGSCRRWRWRPARSWTRRRLVAAPSKPVLRYDAYTPWRRSSCRCSPGRSATRIISASRLMRAAMRRASTSLRRHLAQPLAVCWRMV